MAPRRAALSAMQSNRNFNDIGVRSFILSGAPSTYKTANRQVTLRASCYRMLKHVFPTKDPDLAVINLDTVYDCAETGLPKRNLSRR